MNKKSWHAIYTLPRWEKKVNQKLTEKNIISYCPVNKVRKRWKDRLKWIKEPLFKSYVFVKTFKEEYKTIKETSGVSNFVHWLGKPATIQEKEIEDIRLFLEEHDNVHITPMKLEVGQQVMILSGLLMQEEGTIIKVGYKTAKVAINSLGCKLVAVIEKKKLQTIRTIQ